MLVTGTIEAAIESSLVVVAVFFLAGAFYVGYGLLERFVGPPVIETIQRR